MRLLRALTSLAIALALVALLAVPVFAASDTAGQCPDYLADGNTKIDTTNDDLVLEAGLTICIHASNGNTYDEVGFITTNGTSTLGDYIKNSGLLNNGGQVPGVSNYVIYGAVTTTTSETTTTDTTETTTSDTTTTDTTTSDTTTTDTTTSDTTTTDTTTTDTTTTDTSTTQTVTTDTTTTDTSTTETPTPTVTLPPTDTIGVTASTSTVPTAALLVLAGFAALALVATSVASRNRR